MKGASLRLGRAPTAPSVHFLEREERAAARHAWARLESRIGAPSLASSWDWTGSWLAAYGDLVPHRFALATRGGREIGIALVTEPAQRQPPMIGARTTYVGTAGEPAGETVFVERNRLLTAAEDRGAFAGALLEALAEDQRWDRVALNGLHPDDAAAVAEAEPGLVARVEDSPVAELSTATGGDVMSIFSGRRRQRIRRSVRAFGELETQWAQTPAEAHAILDELIALHQAGWAARGESGAFAGERFTGFHRELIERLVPQGRAVLFRVARADGAAVGCLYGFLEGERLLFYQGGLARFEDNKLRAGLVCHVLCMQACLERGVADYDFLAPASRYKEELSTRTDHLVWAHVERRRLRARLHTHLRRARIRLRAA